MRKVLFVLLTVSLVLVLGACKENELAKDDPVALTDFELVDEVYKQLSIEGLSAVSENIPLDVSYTIGEQTVSISWISSDETIVSSSGTVFRPSHLVGDTNITLTATISHGAQTEQKVFELTVKALDELIVDPSDSDCDGMITLNGDTVVTLTQGFYYRDPEVESEYLSTNTTCPTSGEIWYEVTYSYNGGEPSEGLNTTLIGQHIATYNQKSSEYGINNTATRTINIIEDTSANVESPEEITVDDVRILNEIYVNNTSELESALSGLNPGDAVILRDGTYTDVSKSIEGNGTKANPIFVIAENPGSAIIIGDSQLTIKGSRMIIAGLTFTDGGPKYSGGAIRLVGN